MLPEPFQAATLIDRLQNHVVLVSQQTAGWMAGKLTCSHCGYWLAHKDSPSIILRTVFGKVKDTKPEVVGMSLRRAARTSPHGEPTL